MYSYSNANLQQGDIFLPSTTDYNGTSIVNYPAPQQEPGYFENYAPFAPTVSLQTLYIHSPLDHKSMVYFPGNEKLLPNPKPSHILEATQNMKIAHPQLPDRMLMDILVVCLVEAHLTVMSLNPKELARFIPVSFQERVIERLKQVVCAKTGFVHPSSNLLSSLIFYLQKNENFLGPDILINSNQRYTYFVQHGNGSGFDYDFPTILGLVNSHYPFLAFTVLDAGEKLTPSAILEQAYTIARNLGIDYKNPYNAFFEFSAFWYNRSFDYAILPNTKSIFPQIHVVKGEQGSIAQLLYKVEYTDLGTGFLPVSYISCPGHFPKIMFLPQKTMHLVNLDDLLYASRKYIILTPNIQTALKNRDVHEDVTVLSWCGGANTVETVDWEPLEGKTVFYLVNTYDFWNMDLNKMFTCLEAVRRKLKSLNCTVNILASCGKGQLIQTSENAKFMLYNESYLAKFYRDHDRSVPHDVFDPDAFIIDPEILEQYTHNALFEGLLYCGNIAMLYAPAGIGKTMLALAMMQSLACGQDLNKRHKYVGDKPVSVLYVSGEMSKGELAERYLRFEKMYSPQHDGGAVHMSLFEKSLAEPEGQKELESLINICNQRHKDKPKISVVILDSLKTLTRSGDNAKNWNEFYEFINEMRTQKGLTIILIHHTTKDEKEFFGTSDIKVKLDLMIRLSSEVPNLKEMAAGHGLTGKDIKAYANFLQKSLKQRFSGENSGALSFFFSLAKAREIKNDKSILLMSFWPDYPERGWEVLDISAPDCYLSPTAWIGETEASENVPLLTAPAQSESLVKASYQQLRQMPKEDLLENLKKAAGSGCSSRRKIGAFFGLESRKAKDAVDYLMKKYKLTNADIGL